MGIVTIYMKSFIKNKEDFTCENCGFFVRGTGYTNHCPQCFCSKHVDVNPGDRAQECRGLMRPISVSGSTNKIVITHECIVCGFLRNNKIQKEDNIEKLSQIIEKINSKK